MSFHMILAVFLLITSFFLFKINYFYCVVSLPLCISCLFSMLLNEDTVDIEKPDGISSLTFDVDEVSGLFLHPSIFSIMHSQDLHK